MALPIAVLVSGSGSNLQSIIDRIEAGVLDAEIVTVIANKPDAYGLERARRHNIPDVCIEHAQYPTREAFDAEMARAIRAAGAQTVVLAGFMRLLTPDFLNAFPGRVLNIHPALLPSFPGVHGQGDAAAYGVRISGCTVHFVTEEMDSGPVIIQAAVPAHPDDDGDSLGGRILALEHRIYPQAVQWMAQGRLSVEGRQVRLAPPGDGPAAQAADLPDGCLVNPPLEAGF
jgi:phosphoribosylglycinamide formyltransferase-1